MMAKLRRQMSEATVLVAARTLVCDRDVLEGPVRTQGARFLGADDDAPHEPVPVFASVFDGGAGGIAQGEIAKGAVDRQSLELPFVLEVHSPIHLTRALLPAMIARGSGTLLFSAGGSETASAAVSGRCGGRLRVLTLT